MAKIEHPVADATDHESYWTLTLVAFLVPIAGIIMGAIFMTKDAAVDRKLGEHLIAISFILPVIVAFLYIIGVFSMI